MNIRLNREFLGRIGCFAVLAAIVFLSPWLLFGILLVSGSQRTVYERTLSPDGWHDARVQFDDAGALSSFSRLVFVKHHWNVSDEPLLSCRAFWADGENSVHVRWIDDRTLMIRHQFPREAVQAVADHCGPVRIIVEGPNSANGGS